MADDEIRKAELSRLTDLYTAGRAFFPADVKLNDTELTQTVVIAHDMMEAGKQALLRINPSAKKKGITPKASIALQAAIAAIKSEAGAGPSAKKERKPPPPRVDEEGNPIKRKTPPPPALDADGNPIKRKPGRPAKNPRPVVPPLESAPKTRSAAAALAGASSSADKKESKKEEEDMSDSDTSSSERKEESESAEMKHMSAAEQQAHQELLALAAKLPLPDGSQDLRDNMSVD